FDLVILGDGYTAAEMAKYAADVESLVTSFFLTEPYREYAGFFNVYRVDVVSNESGADHPESAPPVFKDTALDAAYNCGGIQRLICVNTAKVNAVLAATALSTNAKDQVIVLVNDPVYGGSGGYLAVASTHPSVVELMLHETGHSIGLLADEYGDSQGTTCSSGGTEPSQVNATLATTRAAIKWNYW